MPSLRALSVLAGLLAAPFATQGAAIVAPYTTNFDEYATGTSVAPFAEFNSPSGTTRTSEIFDLGGGDKVLRTQLASTGTASAVAANTSDSVTTSPSIVGSNFVLSTNITLQSFSASSSSSTLNFLISALGTTAALGNPADLGATSAAYRLVYTVHAGTGAGFLTLGQTESGQGLTATTAGSLTSSSFITPAAGMNLTMTLTGTYTGTRVDLVGTLTNGTTTLTVNGFDLVASAGENFGVRSALNSAAGTTSSMVVDYNSFSLIPEPNAGILWALGLGIVLLRRRRN
jgi:hypothetical protein